MSKNMETVEDIIRDVRDRAEIALRQDGDATVHHSAIGHMLREFAVRLDAAYHRDTKAVVDANEIAIKTAMAEVAKLREENERLTGALACVAGCADSTCGGMGICRTCSAAQYFGGEA